MDNIKKTISKKVGLGTLYIKGYIEGKNYNKYKEMYERYQYLMGSRELHKKNINDFSNDFNILIDNMKVNGYDNIFPIIVSRELIPIDGHHRVACCLYFNLLPNYNVNNNVSIIDYNGLDWILNNYFICNSYSTLEKIEIINEYLIYNDIFIYYEKSLEEIGKLKMIGKLKIKSGNEKIILIFTENIVKGIYNETNDIKKLLMNIDFEKSIVEKPLFMRNIYIKCYHIFNRLKRIIYEFIKNIIN